MGRPGLRTQGSLITGPGWVLNPEILNPQVLKGGVLSESMAFSVSDYCRLWPLKLGWRFGFWDVCGSLETRVSGLGLRAQALMRRFGRFFRNSDGRSQGDGRCRVSDTVTYRSYWSSSGHSDGTDDGIDIE